MKNSLISAGTFVLYAVIAVGLLACFACTSRVCHQEYCPGCQSHTPEVPCGDR